MTYSITPLVLPYPLLTHNTSAELISNLFPCYLHPSTFSNLFSALSRRPLANSPLCFFTPPTLRSQRTEPLLDEDVRTWGGVRRQERRAGLRVHRGLPPDVRPGVRIRWPKLPKPLRDASDGMHPAEAHPHREQGTVR